MLPSRFCWTTFVTSVLECYFEPILVSAMFTGEAGRTRHEDEVDALQIFRWHGRYFWLSNCCLPTWVGSSATSWLPKQASSCLHMHSTNKFRQTYSALCAQEPATNFGCTNNPWWFLFERTWLGTLQRCGCCSQQCGLFVERRVRRCRSVGRIWWAAICFFAEMVRWRQVLEYCIVRWLVPFVWSKTKEVVAYIGRPKSTNCCNCMEKERCFVRKSDRLHLPSWCSS